MNTLSFYVVVLMMIALSLVDAATKSTPTVAPTKSKRNAQAEGGIGKQNGAGGDIDPQAFYENWGPIENGCPVATPATPDWDYVNPDPEDCFFFQLANVHTQTGVVYPSCYVTCALETPHLRGFECYNTLNCTGPMTWFPGNICFNGTTESYNEYCPGFVPLK